MYLNPQEIAAVLLFFGAAFLLLIAAGYRNHTPRKPHARIVELVLYICSVSMLQLVSTQVAVYGNSWWTKLDPATRSGLIALWVITLPVYFVFTVLTDPPVEPEFIHK